MSNFEESDLNDSDILSNTRQNNGPNESMQFLFTLPSGRIINSEFVGPEDRKRALMAWIGAVRGEILSDLRETRRAKIAESMKNAPQIAFCATDIDPAELAELRPGKAIMVDNGGSMSQHIAPAVSDDPAEHAAKQVAQLEKEVLHWTDELGKARVSYDTAVKKLEKWKKIMAAFTE